MSKRLRWVARLAWRGCPSIVGQTHFLVLGFHTSCPTDPCVSRATFACLPRAKLPTIPGPQHYLLTSGAAQIFLFSSLLYFSSTYPGQMVGHTFRFPLWRCLWTGPLQSVLDQTCILTLEKIVCKVFPANNKNASSKLCKFIGFLAFLYIVFSCPEQLNR